MLPSPEKNSHVSPGGYNAGMIRTILLWVTVGMVLLIALAWLWSGGYRSIFNFIQKLSNPVDLVWGSGEGDYTVNLPWQVPIPHGADIELYLEDGGSGGAGDTLDALQSEYDALNNEVARQARSPYYGYVSLSRGTATDNNPATEHLVLYANGIGSNSVSLHGWSLMSMLSGVRVQIPLATPLYRHGVIQTVQPAILEPGTTAIIATGFSPVGVSFRENRCTGYLAQSLTFDPALANACPSPSESMSLTDQNLQRYGGDCIDYVRSIPQCTFPTSIPASLSTACRIYVANTFSYNGCIDAMRNQRDFNLDTWRMYISSPRELWLNTHDSIRLLDENGRTVDSITY